VFTDAHIKRVHANTHTARARERENEVARMCVYIFVCIHMHIHIHTHLYMYTCACINIHTDAYTDTHTDTYTDTYTYIYLISVPEEYMHYIVYLTRCGEGGVSLSCNVIKKRSTSLSLLFVSFVPVRMNLQK